VAGEEIVEEPSCLRGNCRRERIVSQHVKLRREAGRLDGAEQPENIERVLVALPSWRSCAPWPRGGLQARRPRSRVTACLRSPAPQSCAESDRRARPPSLWRAAPPFCRAAQDLLHDVRYRPMPQGREGRRTPLHG
jgi:hypothetical protein